MADRIVAAAAKTPGLSNPFTSFRAETPWLYLDIDRTEAKVLGVPMSEVFDTLQVYLGSLYVNDFNLFGRTWQVNVQADQNFREQVDDLKQLRVRNDRGQMVPFNAFASVREVTGPVLIARLQHVFRGADQSATRRRASARAKRSSGSSRSSQTRLELVDALRMDRAGAAAAARPATRR